MNLRHDLARFRSFGRAEQRVLLLATVRLPLFRVGLRVLGFQRFHAWLQRKSVLRPQAMSLAQVRALADLVNLAAYRILGSGSCLTRSLLLDWMLRRRGVQGQLRIGVRLDQGALAAHAWVEVDGAPVNDRPDVGADFASFCDLIPLKAFHGQ